ncbi:MAG: hypothetical protein V7637_3916 [Mycobacteriales bacterium]
MGGFQVTPDALGRVGEQLTDASRQVTQVRKGLLGTGGDSSFGANQVDHPINNVIDRWQRALDAMAQETDVIGQMVVAAGKAYAKTDSDVAGACEA